MKRRGFFGLAAGAVVAGPSMAKQAMAQGLESLSLGNQLGNGGMYGLADQAANVGKAVGGTGMVEYIARAKQKLDLINGFTAAQRAKHKAGMHVGQLDPDIASYLSISLSAKIDMQKERNLNAFLSERKTWWQKIAGGSLDPYGVANQYDDEESLY